MPFFSFFFVFLFVINAAAAFLCPRTPLPTILAKNQACLYSSFTPMEILPSQAKRNDDSDAARRRKEIKEELLRSFGQKQTVPTAEEGDSLLACPISLQPLRMEVRLAGPFGEMKKLICPGYKYHVNSVYADLVSDEDLQPKSIWNSIIPRQDLFRSPLTSFLYERGWRDNFRTAGFPGPDEEFEDVMSFMAPLASGGTIIDLSCGSGLMARRFVKSGKWRRVICVDYSEAMLRETKGRFQVEGLPVPALVRADAARLPFQSQKIDAVHAGAVLHCWPRLQESLMEVKRILKPGGRFYASTFEVNERLQSSTFQFFRLEELKGLLTECGFEHTEVRREGAACLIAKCTKGMET